MPLPVAGFQALDPLLPDLRGEHRAEPVPPIADRLMADVGAALVEQILDIPKRQREADIHHHRQADDLGTGFEALETIGFIIRRR